MEYGWAGSGSYLTAPIVVLTSELTGLAPSTGDVLAVSAPFANSQGAIWADIEFIAGGACSPGQDAFLEVWVLRSLDSGMTFEDGSATMAPARGPDKVIQVAQGASITPHSAAQGMMLPPGTFKVAVRNQIGVSLPSGSQIRLGLYGEGSGEDQTTMQGDASGTQAHRIADMLEKFGVITYSQSDISVNPWGAGTSDYTTTSVINALSWLTANSGLHCLVREYHVAGRDTGGGSNQLSWCPTVASATGAKFDISLQSGATTSDVTTLVSMASSSANGSGWMQWAEGLNTPNDGSVTAANCVAVQQAIYSGAASLQTAPYPVGAVGPSFAYATVPPDGASAITGYLSAQQKSDLLAASALASARFFPSLNPGYDDSAGRGGNADDVWLGHQIYWGKPTIIGEWHPTSGNADSPSHATDDSFAAFYAALSMLHFHRLGYQGWFWKSLFDIGSVGDSPYVRVGLFPNSGSDTPRLPARTIRAMYSLTGDSGTNKRTFRPSKLDYSISGLPAPASNATPWTGGHHRLFQNSGGTFFLFIWNEQGPILGSPTTITVRFGRLMSRVVHYDLTTDPTTAETAVSTGTNISSLSFGLTASVHLLVINPQGSIASSESAQGTQLASAAGSIVDANGVAYTLVNNPPFGLQVNHGGVTDSQNVVLLLYWDHRVWQQNSAGNWAYWSGASWVPGTDPRIVPTESPDGLSINGPGTTIYASQTPGQPAGANLDQWTITAGAQAARNGVTDGSTTAVMQLLYHSHTVYMQQQAGNAYGTPGWSQWGGINWAACPSPLGQAESAQGTMLTTVGPAIYASRTPGQVSTGTLDVWTLVNDVTYPPFQANINGAWDGTIVPAGTHGISALYYTNHTVYQRSDVYSSIFGLPGWWAWTGSSWSDSQDPTGGALETTDGTFVSTPGTIIYASQTPGQAASGTLDQWSFNSAGLVVLNGAERTETGSVIYLYYGGHTLYHASSGGNSLGTPGWWRYTGPPSASFPWAESADPRPANAGIAITNIPQQIEGQQFSVSGTLSGYSNPPNLQYRDNQGNWGAAPLTNGDFTASGFSFVHPGLATGGVTASYTVSVRDASNASVQATSNTFSVVPTSSFALADITLSNNAVIAGSLPSTQIGTIAVVATGGTFAGTLAVNDVRFKIVGSSLQTNATLASGNYQINITATQSGATGSPLVRSFTIQAASGNTFANFSAPTGKTVNKTFWGFSTSVWAGMLFNDTTFINTANTTLKPAALAINADWDLDTKYANGQMTDVNNILNNYKNFCQSDVRVVMGVAYKTSAGSAATLAARAANFARYLANNGHANIMDFNVGNSWGDHGGDGLPQSTVISYFNAIADALHGVNANYRVWGPAQWDPAFLADANWGNQVGTRCGGVPWMSYDVAPTSGTVGVPMTDTRDVAYGAKGINNPDAANQRNALANTPLANVAIGSFDWNMSEYANEAGTYVGAVYDALYVIGAFKSTTGVDSFCLQNIGGSSWPGNAIGGDNTTVKPNGYLLGKAGQSVYGPEYTTSTTAANFSILAVKPSSTTFAIVLVNYDLSASRTISLSVTGGVPTGTIARWEIGKSSPNSPTIGTQSGLGSVTVASETVVILTGQLS